MLDEERLETDTHDQQNQQMERQLPIDSPGRFCRESGVDFQMLLMGRRSAKKRRPSWLRFDSD
jgi:hypothetical protein